MCDTSRIREISSRDLGNALSVRWTIDPGMPGPEKHQVSILRNGLTVVWAEVMDSASAREAFDHPMVIAPPTVAHLLS